LELPITSGCTGLAWDKRAPVAADLVDAQKSFNAKWKMTKEQQNKIRPDRCAMFAFPLFELSSTSLSRAAQTADELGLLGTFAVDTSTPLQQTGWVGESRMAAVALGTQWADIISRLLT
jgi:hypothetical protein